MASIIQLVSDSGVGVVATCVSGRKTGGSGLSLCTAELLSV